VGFALLDEDWYRALSGHLRSVWLGMLLERARLEYEGLWPLVSFNRRYLTRQLGLRVTNDDLVALEETGLIEVVTSGMATNARALSPSLPCSSTAAEGAERLRAGASSRYARVREIPANERVQGIPYPLAATFAARIGPELSSKKGMSEAIKTC
jgi:hypothetical protein